MRCLQTKIAVGTAAYKRALQLASNVAGAQMNLTNVSQQNAINSKSISSEVRAGAHRARKETAFFCSAPWTTGWISLDGMVNPCCRLDKFRADLTKAGSLKEVWHSEPWVQFRQKVARGEYPFDICRQCLEASTYQTLWKDFAGVPQGYLREFPSQSLTHDEASLRRRLDRFFNHHDFMSFTLPPETIEEMADLLKNGKAWREQAGAAGDCLMPRLLTLLQVFYDLYTRNPWPEIVMPLRIPVMITHCNARCIMCPMVLDGKAEHGTFMDDVLLERSLTQPDHIVKIWAAATELLLHPRWRQIVTTLSAAHVHLAISTNAIPLTESAAQFLVDVRLKELGFSINGATKANFEEIMPRVNFEQFLKNVKYFVDYNKSQGAPVGVGFTMVALRRNLPELPALIRLIHSLIGPGYGLHVSSLEAPGTEKQRAFYEREHPKNIPRDQLIDIFEEADRVAQELRVPVSCFFYKNINDVIRDLENIPRVAW